MKKNDSFPARCSARAFKGHGSHVDEISLNNVTNEHFLYLLSQLGIIFERFQ